MLYLLQGLHGEIDAATGSGQWDVLLGSGLHLRHDDVRLFHFSSYLRSFFFQGLQMTYDAIIIQDLSFGGIQGLE